MNNVDIPQPVYGMINRINTISSYINKCSGLIQTDKITAKEIDQLNEYRTELPSIKAEFLLEASVCELDEVAVISYLDVLKRMEYQLFELVELNNLYIKDGLWPSLIL